MYSTKKILKQRQFRLFRALVATAFITNGIFPLIAPAFADGTAAGTSISNTATAEYEDPNVPGTKIPATSNTVTVTVAEVAGITVSTPTVTDINGGTAQIGDVINYEFTITNTGNDPTKFRIPSTVALTGPGTVGTLQYNDGSGLTNVASGGTDTVSIPAGGTVLVRVPVTVATTAAAGNTITVTLGNTADPNGQNEAYVAGTGDVFTKDNDNGTATGEVNGAPVNGEREAANTGSITVDTKDYALATLLKTLNQYNKNDPSNISDDTITYGLNLKVENTDVTGQGIKPVALQGINNINIDGNPNSSTPYILISDAIPKDTELNAPPTSTDTNWEAVYTIEPADQNVSGYKDANKALWKRFGAGGTLQGSDTLAQVTRIGFINKATLTSVATGTSVTGFSVTVKVKSTATAPLTVANIAQLFGGSPNPGNTANPVLPVYDESGDQNPSNYDGPPGSMTPPVGSTDSNSDGVPDIIDETAVEDGYINDPTDLTNTGTDTNNNNTGTTPGGDANVIILDTAALLNGPSGKPEAVGPTDNNNDFTNKSSVVPPNTAPGSTIDPDVVTFTNTVRNDGSGPAPITLLPTPPATPGDLPNGTTVVISDPANAGTTATYTYNGTAFTTSDAPIVITVPAGTIANYTVVVDLPAGTKLSTDTEKGYPVPITAFIDSGTPGLDTSDIQNTTINRVYTGFLKLVKYSRILDASGNELTGARVGESDFATTPNVDADTSNDVPRNPRPGEIIEYQIRYKNIASETNAAPANNNVILNVSGLKIIEDGTGLNGNWALDQDTNGIIDTSNVVGSAVDSVPASATITFTPSGDQTGTTGSTDVTKYENSITVQIAPGVERTFTFRRKVN